MNHTEKPIELNLLASRHHEYFAHNILLPSCESWAGGNIRAFAKYLSDRGVLLNLLEYPDQKLDRNGLFELVSKNANSTFNCCVAIVAWGGMNREHALSAFTRWSEWEPIATKIRAGELNRREAYEAFYDLRKTKKLKGLGPAYFTKIIYFLSKPVCRGYILDQWTARSTNLLHHTKVILLNKSVSKTQKTSYFVSDKNLPETYENFCLFIELLAKSYQTTPDLIEMSLFSNGKSKGKDRGEWRTYVITQDS